MIILDNYSEMRSFFEMPFTKEYIKYNDIMVRYLAALLDVMGKDESDPERSDLCSQIMSISRRFLRSSEIAEAAASELSADSFEVIHIRSFISEFAGKSFASSGGRLSIDIAEIPDSTVLSSADMLRYIFLTYLRKYLNTFPKGKLKFIFGCRCEENSTIIRLEYTENDENAFPSAKLTIPELTDKYPDELCMILSARIGAECTVSEKSLELRIAPQEFRGDVTLKSKMITPTGGDFSPYDIMLADYDNRS